MQHNSNHQSAALFSQYKQSTLIASAPIQLYLIYFLLNSTLYFFQICASITIIVSPFLSNSLPPISPSEMFSSCNTSPPPTRYPTLIQSLLFLSTSTQCSTGVLLSHYSCHLTSCKFSKCSPFLAFSHSPLLLPPPTPALFVWPSLPKAFFVHVLFCAWPSPSCGGTSAERMK